MAALDKTLNEIAELSGWLAKSGACREAEGNLSALVRGGERPGWPLLYRLRIPCTTGSTPPLDLLVTAAGAQFARLADDPLAGLVWCRALPGSGHLLCEAYSASPELRPTSELLCHLLVQAQVAEAGSRRQFVVHTHSPGLVALTNLPADRLPGVLETVQRNLSTIDEQASFDLGGIIDEPTGSLQLAAETAHLLATSNAVLWKNHGVIVRSGTANGTVEFLDAAGRLAHWYIRKAAEVTRRPGS